MKKLDLNVDIAEGYPYDHQLLEFCSSANICCGAHAGSIELAQETIRECQKRRIRIGAHPGYPDRETMGRGKGNPAYRASIVHQVASLVETGFVVYIKPHGGLYNESQDEGFAADVVYELLTAFPLPLMGMKGTYHETIALAANVPLIHEGFADRLYTPEGRLVPRSEPRAVLERLEDVVAQASRIAPAVHSICLHGDSEDCVSWAQAVRSQLELDGWTIAP